MKHGKQDPLYAMSYPMDRRACVPQIDFKEETLWQMLTNWAFTVCFSLRPSWDKALHVT